MSEVCVDDVLRDALDLFWRKQVDAVGWTLQKSNKNSILLIEIQWLIDWYYCYCLVCEHMVQLITANTFTAWQSTSSRKYLNVCSTFPNGVSKRKQSCCRGILSCMNIKKHLYLNEKVIWLIVVHKPMATSCVCFKMEKNADVCSLVNSLSRANWME